MSESLAARAAIALDKVLTDPELGARFIELQAQTFPISTIDQAEAASRDALLLMRDQLGGIGGTPGSMAPDAVADWARLGLVTALMEWFAGEADTCLHSPQASRPQPVVAAAWRPRLVVCPACIHLTSIRRNSDEDRTCDCCGRVTTGPEHGDGISPCRLQLGSMVYLFGACGDCRPSEPGGEAA